MIFIQLIIILLFAVLIIFLIKIYKKVKVPKLGALTFVSGGVKTGKSTLSLALAIKELKRRRFIVRFKNIFRSKDNKDELPLLYSNVPVAVPYVPMTNDLLLRKKRFVYGSVVYLQEVSLIADSLSIPNSNRELNDTMLLFVKLFGHSTNGGCLICDSQSISDLHFSFKRCLSNYFYIHSCYKCFILPFIICKVREMVYSYDNSSINVFNDDVEQDLKTIIIPKKTWELFDCYCYSVLTDDLPIENNVIKCDSLKASNIVSFKDYNYLNKKE